MVNNIRKALAGFIMMSPKSQVPVPEVPHREEAIKVRACALRGYSDKDQPTQVMVLPGHEEADILRSLRGVLVEKERPPKKCRYEDGMNLVVFRGVFGSGGYDLSINSVKLDGSTLHIECDFENPGSGIRTTAGFTQPTAMIPLHRLPEGTYKVKLFARETCRTSQGVSEQAPQREFANCKFKVIA